MHLRGSRGKPISYRFSVKSAYGPMNTCASSYLFNSNVQHLPQPDSDQWSAVKRAHQPVLADPQGRFLPTEFFVTRRIMNCCWQRGLNPQSGCCSVKHG